MLSKGSIGSLVYIRKKRDYAQSTHWYLLVPARWMVDTDPTFLIVSGCLFGQHNYRSSLHGSVQYGRLKQDSIYGLVYTWCIIYKVHGTCEKKFDSWTRLRYPLWFPIGWRTEESVHLILFSRCFVFFCPPKFLANHCTSLQHSRCTLHRKLPQGRVHKGLVPTFCPGHDGSSICCNGTLFLLWDLILHVMHWVTCCTTFSDTSALSYAKRFLYAPVCTVPQCAQLKLFQHCLFIYLSGTNSLILGHSCSSSMT